MSADCDVAGIATAAAADADDDDDTVEVSAGDDSNYYAVLSGDGYESGRPAGGGIDAGIGAAAAAVEREAAPALAPSYVARGYCCHFVLVPRAFQAVC